MSILGGYLDYIKKVVFGNFRTSIKGMDMEI